MGMIAGFGPDFAGIFAAGYRDKIEEIAAFTG